MAILIIFYIKETTTAKYDLRMQRHSPIALALTSHLKQFLTALVLERNVERSVEFGSTSSGKENKRHEGKGRQGIT